VGSSSRPTKLPDMRLHDSRHAAASFLIAQGLPLRLIMEILGHSTIAFTANTYGHIERGMMTEAASRMDSHLTRGKGEQITRFQAGWWSGLWSNPEVAASVKRSRNRKCYMNVHLFGGGGGIRTHGDLSTTPVFKTGAFNRSATPPRLINQAAIRLWVATGCFDQPSFAELSAISSARLSRPSRDDPGP
jgi:hypothetical protein